jgi:hypothetical protein
MSIERLAGKSIAPDQSAGWVLAADFIAIALHDENAILMSRWRRASCDRSRRAPVQGKPARSITPKASTSALQDRRPARPSEIIVICFLET